MMPIVPRRLRRGCPGIPVLFCLSGLIILWSPWVIRAQSATADFRADVNLVTLDVSVTQDGVPVPGLTKEAFRVAVDGRPKEIRIFESGSAPLSIVAVLDQSRSMRMSWTALQRSAQVLTGSLKEGDELAMVTFNEHVYDRMPYHPASPQLMGMAGEALDAAKPDGQTALYDAVTRAVNHSVDAHTERRIVLVISDGADSASKTTQDATVELLRSSNVAVYALGLFDPAEIGTKARVLKAMAEATGGVALFEPDSSKLPVRLDSLLQTLRARYFLGVLVNAPTRGKREIRKLRVGVTAPDGKHLHTQHRPEFILEAAIQ